MILQRTKFLKRYSSKTLHEGAGYVGATCNDHGSLYTHFSISISGETKGAERYYLNFDRYEAERLYTELGAVLKRDLNRVNGRPAA